MRRRAGLQAVERDRGARVGGVLAPPREEVGRAAGPSRGRVCHYVTTPIQARAKMHTIAAAITRVSSRIVT
jgi:hypothetical protein